MSQAHDVIDREQLNVNIFERNLGAFGWAAIFIVTGILWLIPERLLPNGIWLMSMGFILLGLNAARYSVGRRWEGCSLTLGVLALAAGVGAFLHVNTPALAITLIVIGLLSLFVPRRESRTPGNREGGCC